MKRHLIAFGSLLLIGGQTAWAATVEVVPMVGYQFNSSKDLAGPRNDRLDFKDVPLRGLSIGYLNKEDGELELSYTRAYSAAQVQRTGGAPADRFDARVEQYHFNGLYMIDPEANDVRSFVLLGLGATTFTPSGDRSSTTLFSFAVGGGFKWLWNDHIGLRFDARWTPALVTAGTHFFCDDSGAVGCYSTQPNSYFAHIGPFLNTFDVTSGLMLRY